MGANILTYEKWQMGKDKEIKRLTDELDVVRHAYTIEMILRLQKEEEEETRHIAELYDVE